MQIFICYIATHYIVNPSYIAYTLDLDRIMLDSHMLYRLSQPHSQDVELHKLYRQTLYRQSVS